MDIRRLFRRAFFLIAYNFYLKRKISKKSVTKAFGFSLIIPPSVFHPNLYFSTRFFGNYIQKMDLAGKAVLEIGCGSGVLSLLAASRGASVSSVDINPQAVNATRENAVKNHLEKSITMYHGNLFDPLPMKSKFDYIFFNPPFYHGEPTDSAEWAWKGGVDYAIIKRFINTSGDYLDSGGKLLIILSSDMDVPIILEALRGSNFEAASVASKQTIFDTLFIYQAQRVS